MSSREDETLARAAVAALTRQLELTPKPGLPDPRDLGARVTRQDHRALRWSAKALVPGLAAMAACARRNGAATPELRAELGAIGRCTEHSMQRAGGGHRGATWVLGLLVAAAAMEPGARGRELAATAKKIAAHPDRRAPRRPSRGSSVSAKYGAAGARGEARAGFPHVRRALDVLAKARTSGTPEPYARLDALLTVMSTLQDTELLYTAGPHGLRTVQAGARAVIDAGGTTTDAGREALTALDTEVQERGWSPRGSGSLLAGALFVDALPVTSRVLVAS
ncbi:triphosphoribosyl-dephospho-CoA synthase [Streptomyces griseiscabiei]|uniref:triphosphoribosyl-dephospho-CoA synthase n=1 Tax=Streptomyces griseiscabiei TaxID=2993540 RepID=A0ABU4LAJ4_9ACTN|nr:triphosphoribosyl-dephospho-CoA synthase [Streptomyces griseiscabiei]MBZ3907682.1 triphosphoribosyl-dephospho-CoA synthase [Streptomyces griseiscabiei]MDX2912633.1 triphosphoribosyl-dephospho-CoA synthase [Streptomyces griseiscabiei]